MASRLKGVLQNILLDARKQFRDPHKSFAANFLTRTWSRQSRAAVNAAIQRLQLQPDHKILEVGYGRGDGLQQVYDIIKDGEGAVFGLERSRYMQTLVENRFAVELHEKEPIYLDPSFLLMHLAYPTDCFDGVLHVDVFYFWRDREMYDICKEFYRVLKPGREVVCGMELKRLKRLAKYKILEEAEYDPMRYLQCLEPAGFQDVKVSYEDVGGGREIQLITARKPALDEASVDPEAQFARLEDEVKEYLAMESLLREKKVIPERVRRNLDNAERSGKEKEEPTDSDKTSQSRSAPEKEENQRGKEEEPQKRAKATG
ncbi:Protein H20J04.9 [Aphelenchoides avenae]|nr:Protein H20J04.9 [Aphelenchus avenae]